MLKWVYKENEFISHLEEFNFLILIRSQPLSLIAFKKDKVSRNQLQAMKRSFSLYHSLPLDQYLFPQKHPS